MKQMFIPKIEQGPDMTIRSIGRNCRKLERFVGRRASLALLFGAGWLSGCGGLKTMQKIHVANHTPVAPRERRAIRILHLEDSPVDHQLVLRVLTH